MKKYKKYLYISLYLVILGIVIFGIYLLQKQVATFSEKNHEMQVRVRVLEDNKKVLDLYKKMLVQGSKEQKEIERYIINSKNTFDAVSQIEKDAKSIGLIGEDKGGIMSVTSRENADLEKYDAHELLVDINVEQDSQIIDKYIEALSNLPYVSHIEKIKLIFDNKNHTTNANITLVLTVSK